MDQPSVNARLVALGISKGYASDIANGKRKPGFALAMRIFKATGLRFGPMIEMAESGLAETAESSSTNSDGPPITQEATA